MTYTTGRIALSQFLNVLLLRPFHDTSKRRVALEKFSPTLVFHQTERRSLLGEGKLRNRRGASLCPNSISQCSSPNIQVHQSFGY